MNKFERHQKGKRDRTLSMVRCWLGMKFAGAKSRKTSKFLTCSAGWVKHHLLRLMRGRNTCREKDKLKYFEF